MPDSSSSTSHCPEPAFPAATEIAYDISHVEPSPEGRIETLRAAGIKVHDFVYELMPNSSKAPEVFDPVPCLIAADTHMRNPDRNHGLVSPKTLPSHQDGLALPHGRQTLLQPVRLRRARSLQRQTGRAAIPFVTESQNESMPTPSHRIRLRRQAGLATYPDDYPDKVFLGYNPTGYSDDEAEGGPPRAPTHVPAEMTLASTSAVVDVDEAEAVSTFNLSRKLHVVVVGDLRLHQTFIVW